MRGLSDCLIYFRTCLRLRPSQIFWRLRYTVRRRLFGRGAGVRIFRRLAADCLRRKPVPSAADFGRLGLRRFYAGDLSALRENRFTLLNETMDFGPVVDWTRTASDRGTRLWKFTLNYHEYLIDVARAWRSEGRGSAWGKWFESHVREWMRQNPPDASGHGRDNWNTYCLSMRIVAWIRVWSLVGEWLTDSFRDDFLRWLWVQCRFAADNIEYDILGNHIVKDWKALAFAASFWGTSGGVFADRARVLWRKFVLPQIDDGGQHEELSPMYGAIVLEDLLEGLAVQGEGALKRELPLLRRMSVGLERLHFGEHWAHFNDSADGMAPTPRELADAYARILGEPWPAATGPFATNAFAGVCGGVSHWVVASGRATHGPQPGHAHADACALEWARDGRQVFANAGVFDYNPGARRDFVRSAAAHNTAVVEGHSLHEFWGAFRCARTGACETEAWTVDGDAVTWSGRAESFDGAYAHERVLEARPDAFRCRDRVTLGAKGAGSEAKVLWRLAPGLRFVEKAGCWQIVDSASGAVVAELSVASTRTVEIAFGFSFPAYGLETPVEILTVRMEPGTWVETSVRFFRN